MIIACPGCGARYRIDPSRAAKAVARIKCPQCTKVFEIAVAVPDAAPAFPEPAATVAPPAAPAAAKVLVVDDSKFFRELLIDVLRPLNLTFLLAADGAEALQLIRREHPSLVILDLNLPAMNGYELIREVRADASLCDIRMLAMSGVYRKETDAAQVQAAGADDFINKSFRPEQLQFRVQKLLERKG